MKADLGILVLGLACAIWGRPLVAQTIAQCTEMENKTRNSGCFEVVAWKSSGSGGKETGKPKPKRINTPTELPENDLGRVLKVVNRDQNLIFVIQCKRDGKDYKTKDYDRKHDKFNIRLTIFDLEGIPEFTEIKGKLCHRKGDILEIPFFISSSNPYKFELTTSLTGFRVWD